MTLKKSIFLTSCAIFIFTGCFLQLRSQGLSHTTLVASNASGILHAVPSAVITVCPYTTSSTIPCTSPTVSLYSDPVLTKPISNPFNADINGNVNFFTNSGNYTVTASGIGYSGYLYSVAFGPALLCAGTINLSTGAIGSASRFTNSLSCPGIGTTTSVDTFSCNFNGDTNAVTGYAPSTTVAISLKTWISANNINVDQINNTAAPITPGAVSLFCKGTR